MFEISSCSYLTVLPDPAWVLLSNKYILFPGALYTVYLPYVVEIACTCKSATPCILRRLLIQSRAVERASVLDFQSPSTWLKSE